MGIVRDWKLHGFALGIVVACELIGIIKYGVLVFLPMLYAMVLGGIVSFQRLKLLSEKNMVNANKVLSMALLLLVVKLGLDIGPALPHLFQAKSALLLQEIGHFLGTILFGLPLAIMLGMGREAIGATYSIDREPNVAIIIDKYGLDSPEGRGVMAMYICGTLFGALWIGVLTGAVAQLDIFHPYALAMGAGIGSGSMMAASTGAIVAIYPQMEQEIRAYAGAANLLTTILGIYVCLFISLPVAIKMYDVFNKLLGRNKDSEDLKGA